MAIFGNTDISGGKSQLVDNYISGIKASPSLPGTVTKISAFLSNTVTAKKTKCALYKDSDDSLIGSSNEILVPVQSFAWVEFICNIPVQEGIDYQIVIWGEAWTGQDRIRYQLGAWTDKFKIVSFNTWPNPWTGYTVFTRHLSIYATYTPSVPPYPVGRLKKDVIHGFNCFINAYVLAKLGGFAPLKLPDGTMF